MEDLKSKLLFLIVILFVAKLVAGRIYDPTVHRGPWYSVKIPVGWQKQVEGDEVFFRSPEKDALGNPGAVFSIYGHQSKGALFIEDFFEEVIAALSQQRGQILQRGEIKIDNEISRWVLFRMDDPEWIIWTFYVVDDFNRLTKIQFLSKPKDFAAYRPVFEEFKDSIRIRRF